MAVSPVYSKLFSAASSPKGECEFTALREVVEEEEEEIEHFIWPFFCFWLFAAAAEEDG